MNNALIGYTGFVGGSIRRQSDTTFTDLYNSKNIGDIRGNEYDLVVCAGISAEVWRANQEPEQDMANIQGLLDHLDHVQAKQFVLISSVDVFPTPIGVNEDSEIDPTQSAAYGRNRYAAEEFVRSRFENHLVMRLAGLFGEGMKKNLVFDLMTGNDPNEWTNAKSVFQMYDMSRIWADMQTALENNLQLVHCTAAPITTGDIATEAFGAELAGNPEKDVRVYDFMTKHAALFGGADTDNYFYDRTETIERIKAFVASQNA